MATDKPNYDLTNLAVKMIAPNNEVIQDTTGDPGIYVRRPAARSKELLTSGTDTIHPAFRINGQEIGSIAFGKYQGVRHNGKIYSLPGEDPVTTINYETFVKACRDKGAGHHGMTYAEYGYLALLAKKNKTMPKGNNQWGKDIADKDGPQIAIPKTLEADRINQAQHVGQPAHVATGTGPVSWSDTGDLTGIWDLNGNVYEWSIGIRIKNGELQVIKDNDAATNTADMSDGSDAWRALNAAATTWDQLYVAPGDHGDVKTVKLDWDPDTTAHWEWTNAIGHPKISDGKGCKFYQVKINENITGAITKEFLKLVALAPEDAASDTDYGSDDFYARNDDKEYMGVRGGYWASGAYAGVFRVYFNALRANADIRIGGRPAFVETAN